MTLSDYTAIQPSVVYSLLGIGSVLLTWALFWNRARGRKRCPTCWYDMADAPSLVCPECGRDARCEKRLTKTRRRKRWAACALFLFAGSYAAHVGPAAHARLQIKIVGSSSVRDMALTPLSRSVIPEDDARIQPVIVHVYCY